MRGVRGSGFGRGVLVSILLVLSLVVIVPPLARRATAQLTWVVETVDFGNLGPNGSYGLRNPSLAVDSQNWPHIAYFDTWNHSLKYASRNVGGWHIFTVDTADCFPPYDEQPSLALDSLDRPWIAYGAAMVPCDASWDLRLAHWDGVGWETQTVNPPGIIAGWQPSLDLDALGRPRIAFFANVTTNREVWYAEWDGSTWLYEVVLKGNFVGTLPNSRIISLKVDARGYPGIAIAQPSRFVNLSYYYQDGGVWQWRDADPTATLQVDYVSLAFDSHDFPSVSYAYAGGEFLRYARWDGSQWIRDLPTTFGLTGAGSSLAIDSSDEPHISYTHAASWGGPGPDVPNYTYYVRKSGGLWIWPETPDRTEMGWGPSLALDSHDLPHIAWLLGNMHSGYELRYAYAPWVDTAPPVSSILPISPYWNGSPVQAVAVDESGVANVTLWFRFSADNSTWGSWTQFSTLDSPSWIWSFTFPGGEGYYEYYSTAIDVMGNVEPPPATADAMEGYDITPPVSTALPISPYWHTAPSIVVDAAAIDNLSGVADVTLFYSHAPLDNSTWSPWIPLDIKTAQPWSWPFSFPDGEGHYEFHTIAEDIAGNIEGNKAIAEAVAGYRYLPDYTPVDPLPSSPITAGLSKTVPLSVCVANLNGYADSTATLAFFNSSSPFSPFSPSQIPPIAGGDNSGPFTATWDSPATPGTYQVLVSADYYKTIVESNESNNVYTWTIDVVGGPITSFVIGNPNYTSTLTYVKSTTPLDFFVIDQSGTGILNTTYRIDNGTWVNYTATGQFFLAGDGDHYVEWYSVDRAGNRESTSHRVLRVDDTPPSLSIDPLDSSVSIETSFTIAANDGRGCGVAVLEYRIDDGSWTPYSSPFTLSAGWHNVTYRSWDHLNNSVERTHMVEVASPEVPPGVNVAVNYKPIVALVFAITLLVAGVWSSKRRPWKGGKDRMAVAKAFAITSLPFVTAEAVTGVVSFLTGQLSIPPLIGAGTALDLAILVAGLAVAILRIVRIEPSGAEETSATQKR